MKFFNEMEVVIKQAVAKFSVKPDDYIGCSDQEIKALHLAFPEKRFPVSYISFLKIMGKRCPHLSMDVDITFPSVIYLKEDVEIALRADKAEGIVFDFKESDFVFADHDGFIYYFFNCEEGDDPPVYEYVEGRIPVKYANSFTAYLKGERV